jgi:hypothetical protein
MKIKNIKSVLISSKIKINYSMKFEFLNVSVDKLGFFLERITVASGQITEVKCFASNAFL